MCSFASIAPDAPLQVIGIGKHLFLSWNKTVFVTTTVDGFVIYNGHVTTIMEVTRKVAGARHPSKCWVYKGMTLEMLNVFIYKMSKCEE